MLTKKKILSVEIQNLERCPWLGKGIYGKHLQILELLHISDMLGWTTLMKRGNYP